MLIVFEGMDGCGKSTQAARAAALLAAEGHDVIRVREPGGTALGERVREILLDKRSGELAVESELFLFMAARAQLVRSIVAPAIAAGRIVVADRFVHSSLVYQGIVGGLGIDAVRAVATAATAGIEPTKVFVLDVDPAVAARRRGRPDDRMEGRGADYHQQIRAAYLAVARGDPRCVVIDGERDARAVHDDIARELGSLIRT